MTPPGPLSSTPAQGRKKNRDMVPEVRRGQEWSGEVWVTAGASSSPWLLCCVTGSVTSVTTQSINTGALYLPCPVPSPGCRWWLHASASVPPCSLTWLGTNPHKERATLARGSDGTKEAGTESTSTEVLRHTNPIPYCTVHQSVV